MVFFSVDRLSQPVVIVVVIIVMLYFRCRFFPGGHRAGRRECLPGRALYTSVTLHSREQSMRLTSALQPHNAPVLANIPTYCLPSR